MLIKYRFLFFLFVIVLVTGACALLPATPGPQETDPDALYTQAAETVLARLTQQASDSSPGQLTQTPAATSPEAQATSTPMLPQTGPATATSTQSLPTATSVPPSLTPLPSPTPVPCNRVEFVQDISVLDGTVFGPGAEFTKIWRVRNDGGCTWNGTYSLVYLDGAPAGSPASLPLFGNVRPGETVDLAVDLRAPSQSGTYRSNWMLRSPEGVLFGLGAEADRPFWVEIRVVVSAPNSRFSFDFAANLCTAAWHTNAGTLPCLGESNSEEGSVLLLEQPELETGRTEDELTLWTRPAEQQDGYISGTYPAYKVDPGDHFLADIGCLVDNNRCDVTFSLDYTIDGYTIRNLGAWREVYDGAVTRIDVDLSGLAGHSVQFILTVINNGRPSEADAFWLAPSVRSGSPTNGLENIPAAQAARLRLAQSLGIDVSAVAFTSIAATEWSDSCLGVHIPDQVCAPVIVSGYRIGMAANARQFEAHTNSDGTVVLWFER